MTDIVPDPPRPAGVSAEGWKRTNEGDVVFAPWIVSFKDIPKLLDRAGITADCGWHGAAINHLRRWTRRDLMTDQEIIDDLKLWLACNRTDEAKQNEERIQAIAAANSTIQAARENIEYYESSLKMMAEAVAQEMAQVVANQRDLDPNWLGGMLGLMLKVPHIVQKETAKIESEKKEMEDLLKQIERAASKL